MGWYGYETTGQEERRPPICRVVLDLVDTRLGGAAVSIRVHASGGHLPPSREDREALAEVLQSELKTALDE
jgi:hypothetical protein